MKGEYSSYTQQENLFNPLCNGIHLSDVKMLQLAYEGFMGIILASYDVYSPRLPNTENIANYALPPNLEYKRTLSQDSHALSFLSLDERTPK